MDDISQKAVLGAFARHGLSQKGADFVLMAADPFHDENYNVVGLPDQTSGRSYIATIRQEISIKRPSTVALNSAWSAHVAFMPVISSDYDSKSTLTNQVTTNDNSGIVAATGGTTWNANASLLVVSSQPDGDPSFDPVGTATCEYQTVDVPELTDRTTRARLLGGGYEVHNVTEELHRSGQVTDYRVDSDIGLSTGKVTKGAPGEMLATYLKGTLPPNTLANAKQINGVTREAAHGSMVVLCRDQNSHAAELPFQGTWILNRYDEQATVGYTDGICCIAADTIAEPGEILPYCRELPFMQSGSYYSGLSYESKLNLSVVFFVEIFPSPGSVNMALSAPAPNYDPQAMELLSYIQSATLPGYPVSWNSLGRFTRWMHKAVKSAANGIKKAMPFISAGADAAAMLPGPAGAVGRTVQRSVEVARHAGLESGSQPVQKISARSRRRRRR